MNNKFPKNFMWGAATSAYQVEGGNSNSDWWQWEEQGRAKEKSGIACDYWNRYKSDHDLLQDLGVNAFRLSLEWARIEPEEGVFSQEALEHYREILQDLKKRNIKTQVTFWWWVSPIWFQEKYTFNNKKSVELFARYVRKATEELGDLIDIFTVLNEPMVPLGQGFLTGLFPPGFKNPFKFFRAVNNIAAAYVESYKIIHQIKPEAQVGITTLYNWFEVDKSMPKAIGSIISRIAKWFRIDLLCGKIKGHMDYFGMNYYRIGRLRFDPKNSLYLGFRIDIDKHNAMEWVTYPEGMYKALKEIKQDYNLPIIILENGIPTHAGIDDEDRIVFLKNHLKYVKKAIDEGVDVRGYNFWSLMDNLEWLYGYAPKFGLIEMDYKTLERKPRKSFYAYKEIIKKNGLE